MENFTGKTLFSLQGMGLQCTFAAFWFFLYYREKLDAKKTNKTEKGFQSPRLQIKGQILKNFGDPMSVNHLPNGFAKDQ